MSDDRAADLVDRLREAGWQKHANNDDVLMLEAADEVERLRVALADAESQNELLEGDVLRFLRQRNAALERAAAETHPGPDGADDLIRRELVREWVDEGHDRVDEEDRQRLLAIQRMVAAEAELVAVRAALQGLMVQAAIVYDAYDNEERGAAMWQEMIALEAARAVAAGVLNREGWCETCQMTVAANHAHDDTCGHCSGGPVVNSDCPIHGAAGVLTKDSDT